MKEGSNSTSVLHNTSYPGSITTQVYYTFMSENVTVVLPEIPDLWDRKNKCDTIDTSYNVPLAVTCAMCFVFGIIYTFFGKFNINLCQGAKFTV